MGVRGYVADDLPITLQLASDDHGPGIGFPHNQAEIAGPFLLANPQARLIIRSRSGIQARVRNRVKRLGVVMVEQGDRAIGITIDACINQIAMFLQLISLKDLLQREKTIAFRSVKQLGTYPLYPSAAAPPDESKMKVLVPAFPFGVFTLA